MTTRSMRRSQTATMKAIPQSGTEASAKSGRSGFCFCMRAWYQNKTWQRSGTYQAKGPITQGSQEHVESRARLACRYLLVGVA